MKKQMIIKDYHGYSSQIRFSSNEPQKLDIYFPGCMSNTYNLSSSYFINSSQNYTFTFKPILIINNNFKPYLLTNPMGNNASSLELSDPIIEPKPQGCCDKVSLYVSEGNADPSDVTCPICFRIFANPRVMKCKHKYCEQCISTWGKGNIASCPFCRIELKRQRGTFGRIDKKTEKKIEKLGLKCRNCCWEGSYFMYLTTFDVQPYLDDGELPVDNNDDDSCHNIMKQEKEENPELEKTGTKAKQQDKEKQQKFIKEAKMLEKKQTTKAMELFASTLLELAQSGRLDISQLV